MPRTPHAGDRTAAAPAPAPEPSDPDPVEPAPAGRLCVPVRPGGHGVTTRLYRTPVGARTAVAFTTPERLHATLGTAQPWIPLAEAALRALTRPLGVRALTVDPVLTAPFTPAPDSVPEAVPVPAPAPDPDPEPERAPVPLPEPTPGARPSAAPAPAPAPAPASPAPAPTPAHARPGTPCARRFDPAARGTAA
ncbi:SAV_915 family protein [Streptomyces sp. NPDC007863]|uniref:SAV_915 family protein n=1 Tax=Streptomyces sp. NPDC007863 TaxID=3154894 RepID=UPI0033E762E4